MLQMHHIPEKGIFRAGPYKFFACFRSRAQGMISIYRNCRIVELTFKLNYSFISIYYFMPPQIYLSMGEENQSVTFFQILKISTFYTIFSRRFMK